jgi:hypothetical protein
VCRYQQPCSVDSEDLQQQVQAGAVSTPAFLMLALRLTAPNDYTVLEDGQPIGRIRLARERSPPIWLWTVTVTIPGPPFGDATIASESPDRACPETVHRRQHHHRQDLI